VAATAERRRRDVVDEVALAELERRAGPQPDFRGNGVARLIDGWNDANRRGSAAASGRQEPDRGGMRFKSP